MGAVTVDLPRRRLRLTPSALTAAVLLLPGPLPPRLGTAVAAEVAMLEGAGLVRRQRLVAWVADLVALVVGADARTTVQRAEGAERSVSEIWAGAGRAAVGEVDDDGAVTLWATDPTRLGSTLAELVGLGEHPEPIAAGLQVPTVRLARFDELIASGDPSAAGRSLLDGPPGRSVAEVAALLALATNERRAWRVTSTSTDPSGGPVVRSLAVLDAGLGGLWLVDDPAGSPLPAFSPARGEPPGRPDRAPAAVLTAATADDVLERLGLVVVVPGRVPAPRGAPPSPPARPS